MPPRKPCKYIVLVGDGMGDLPLPSLAGRTALEAARTPAMDWLASRGELFRVRTVPEGYPPGSDVANLSLLGYLPAECYTGRAPLEAASLGVRLADDETAFRCNLVTLDFPADGQIVMTDYSAGHITSEEGAELVQALAVALPAGNARLYPGVSYRHLYVTNTPVDGLDTVPPHDFTGQDVRPHWERYGCVPELAAVMERAREVLADHPVNRKRQTAGKNPANAVWLWGQGRTPAMRTFAERCGLSGALISAVDLLKGIAVCAGLEVINVPGATGYLDTNYEGKADAALAALLDKDFVLVHVEAPDEAGHQGLIPEKVRAIEDFDQRVVQRVLDGMRGKDFRLLVAMDHYTPIALKTHTALPVPVLLYDSRAERMLPARYTEQTAEAAGLVLPDGRALFEKFLGEG